MKKWIPLVIRIFGIIFPTWTAKWAFNVFTRPMKYPRPLDEQEFWETGETLILLSGAHAKKFGVGPCVWMIPGWEGRGSQFKDLTLALMDEGFSVMLWEAPGHGDTPGKNTNMIEVSLMLEKDMRSQVEPPRALIGHSFGGATSCLVAGKNIPTPLVVVIAAPIEIFKIFKNYWERIQLPARARKVFLELAEKKTGVVVQEVNTAQIAKGYQHRMLIIHDENDKEVPFSNLAKFKEIKPDVEIYGTQGLGHRRILSSPVLAKKIVSVLKEI
jgi:alpha-beta hydrolase superfamily lysophospholipase